MMRAIVAVWILTATLAAPAVAHEAPVGNVPIYLPFILTNYVGAFPTSAKGMGTHHPEWCYADEVGATWHYNWVGDVPQCPGVESVPMIYCGVHLEYIEQGHCTLMNSEWVMGFNEPDDARQANMTPQEAAEAWPRVEALAQGRKLVSPAVVWHPSWLADFRDAYLRLYGREPQLDALAVHCYTNDVATCQAQIEQVTRYAIAWNVPEVWVTEFMLWGENAEWEMVGLVAWMEMHPRITRYAWFPGTLTGEEDWIQAVSAADRARYMEHQLVLPNGNLTPWGQAYAWAH